jgi:Domain of unknown function (DUF4160)
LSCLSHLVSLDELHIKHHRANTYLRRTQCIKVLPLFSTFLFYNVNMPTISTFYGILIRMFFNDHAPPHFHVQYAEFKATVEIKTLTIASGELPRRAQELVLDWAELHQQELLEDWRLCMEKQQPNAIAPLK